MLVYIGVRVRRSVVNNVNSKKRVPKEKASCTDDSLGIQSYTCRVFTVH